VRGEKMGYLDNVKDDKVFVLGTKKLFSIEDLLDELNSISDEEYSHYASENHNYFADWIIHVVKYDKLAADLINTNGNRKNAIRVLDKHIKKLKSKPVKKIKPIVIKKESVQESVETDPIIQEVLKQSDLPIIKKTELLKNTEEQPKIKKVSEPVEEPESELSIYEIEDMLMKLSKQNVEIRNVIWKHFKWELAKEFMYGMAIGMIMGLILSKLFMP